MIDVHSHLGVYARPGRRSSDGNEATNPATPQVWAEHSVWPQDPQFPRNLAGGVTTLQVLPGSANLIGGRSVVAQGRARAHGAGDEVSGREVRPEDGVRREPEARLRQKRGPSTRMGNVAGYRAHWIKAEQLSAQVGLAWHADRQGRSARRATSGSRRWPRCCAATSSCRTTAIAPTRWRR